MTTFKSITPLLLAVLIAGASFALATPLSPLMPQVTPGNFTLPAIISPTAAEVGTPLDWMHGTFSFTSASGTTSGDFWSAVFRNPSGTLDFYYQVYNSAASKTAVRRIATDSFTGFDTYVGMLDDGSVLGHGFTNGNLFAGTADSDDTGSVIGFNYLKEFPGFGVISPGMTTDVVVISTNAIVFRAGDTHIIDGFTADFSTFQPGVPEPGTMTLMGLGLFAVAAFLRAGRR